jgi:hypothetical protein
MTSKKSRQPHKLLAGASYRERFHPRGLATQSLVVEVKSQNQSNSRTKVNRVQLPLKDGTVEVLCGNLTVNAIPRSIGHRVVEYTVSIINTDNKVIAREIVVGRGDRIKNKIQMNLSPNSVWCRYCVNYFGSDHKCKNMPRVNDVKFR